MDIYFKRRLWYEHIKRANAGRPSTERYYTEDAERLFEGGEQISEVLQQVPGGVRRKRSGGIKFFYRTTLKREEVVDAIQYPKCKRKLPVVLDLSEVESLFSVTTNLKHKAILMITYSSGLRISEAARLKVTDIGSKRMMVRIQQGKGGKDRYSILSHTALECLRQYWRKYRPKE
jgi:integrase